MLSMTWTNNDRGEGTYTLSDSATGLEATFSGVVHGSEMAQVWLRANTDLLIARAQRDFNFIGEVPESAE